MVDTSSSLELPTQAAASPGSAAVPGTITSTAAAAAASGVSADAEGKVLEAAELASEAVAGSASSLSATLAGSGSEVGGHSEFEAVPAAATGGR